MANKQLQEILNTKAYRIMVSLIGVRLLVFDFGEKNLIKKAADRATGRIPEILNTKVYRIIVSLLGVRLLVFDFGELFDNEHDGWAEE